jgi:hypothetical protein
MIQRKAPKNRRLKIIRSSLDDAAIDRIVGAARTALDDLGREELRTALEWVPARYATHQSLRVSIKRKHAQLGKILKAAKRLSILLSGDAWLLILNRLSVSDPDPRGGLVWLMETTSNLLQEPPDRLLALTKDFSTESSLEHIAGTYLPAIFERHLCGSRGRSRKADGTPTGPCVRFVHQAMAELGMPYDKESIVRAMSRAKPGGAPRKK